MENLKEKTFGAILWIGVIAGIVSLLTGCGSMQDKAVILDSDIYGFKATLGADPTSGSVTPSLAFGSGGNLLIDLPIGEEGTLEYEKESGSIFGELFGVSVSDKVKVRMTSGASGIKVETQTDESKKVTTSVGGGKISVNVKDDTVLVLPQN